MILAEYSSIDFQFLFRNYNIFEDYYKIEQIDIKSRIVLLRKNDININIIFDDHYFSAFKLSRCNNKSLILYGLHLPSRMHMDKSEINAHASIIAKEIEATNIKYDVVNSIIIGDFNMNPFDDGMTFVTGFNAVMCPQIAKKIRRTFLKNEYKYYYNPMWSLMGQDVSNIKGTFYYQSSSMESLFWHTYDQVLINGNLLNEIKDIQVKIINNIGKAKLTTDKNSIPDCEKYSDHLPIYLYFEEDI